MIDFESRWQKLLDLLGLGYPGPEESSDQVRLAEYLKLLEPVTEPDLAPGRARLLQAAVALEERANQCCVSHWLEPVLGPGLAAGFVALFVAAVLYLASGAAWPFLGPKPGHGAANPGPVFAASATLTERPPATFEPTPGISVLSTMPQPAATPAADLAPVPPRNLTVTLTRAAPSKP
ncbi:MAG: hypothetical protein ACM3JD_06100 [Rudaea sp.]